METKDVFDNNGGVLEVKGIRLNGINFGYEDKEEAKIAILKTGMNGYYRVQIPKTLDTFRMILGLGKQVETVNGRLQVLVFYTDIEGVRF